MKILIVDDEMITIKMLKTLIDWEKLGLELVGYANDGAKAYDILKNEKVDIILSDIRMANMNGIELIKKVKNLDEDVKFILMSAYADFEYAKEAMQLGCSNYILKPIDEIELEKTLRKVIEEIRGKEDKKRIVDSSIRKLQLFELYKYMKYGKNINSVLKDINSYGVSFNNYHIILIQQENSSMDEYMRVNSIELFHHKYIEKILDGIIAEKYKKNYVDLLFDDDSCALIVEQLNDDEISVICRDIQDKFLEDVEIETRVFISELGTELNMLPILYEKLEKDIVEKIDENNYEEKKYSEAVEKCLKIIERDYDKNITLDEVTKEVAVSKNYFCHVFKKEMHMSIWNYLTKVRLEKAKELLRESDMKSYEIAFKVGYDNPSYFSKIFKKIEKMTSNEYREKHNIVV